MLRTNIDYCRRACHHHLTLVFLPVVTVSFQPVEYMVSEVMGSVVLRLIKIGAIDIPVTVTVTTMDGTAAGYIIQLFSMFSL